MCGIAGVVYNQKSNDGRALLDRMLGCIIHRGPDDHGVWWNQSVTVGLGQRRLSIIDLSLGGHQPRTSADGRYTIVFNGEIYNYRELKSELEAKGYVFDSTSDTEVLLYAYIEWKERSVEKLNGMFSFAVWDEHEQTLFAARDRLGEKPFKYCQVGGTFIFASEVKALLSYPGVSREIDLESIDLALSLRFVPAPLTGFKQIHKLPAGHYLVLKHGAITIKRYWQLPHVTEVRSMPQWKESLWSLFSDSVSKRMQSDVPLGAFLSGGVDSTSVVAAMSEHTKRPIETFVISLEGMSEDQKYAKLAASFFKTNHHEIALRDIAYADAVASVARAYDEPFFDQSALPSVLISQHIKKFVTVVLSGDGGDELFGGYPAYQFARWLQTYNRVPELFRKALYACSAVLPQRFRYYAEIIKQPFFAAYTEYYALWKTELSKSHQYLTKHDLYLPVVREQIDSQRVARYMESCFGASSETVNNAMAGDITGRLADGYLTKVDIATMQSAVETRPPFLDHRLVELSTRIPSALKIRGTQQKYIWHEVVRGKIPEEILHRPKVGFAVPLGTILMGPLKEYAYDVLFSSSAKIYNFVNRTTVQRLWSDQLACKADYSNHIWSLMMLELWLTNYTSLPR